MKLKIKTAGLVGIAMGIFILMLFVFIRPFLLNDAQYLDEESLRIDMLRVSNYIDSEADALQRLNRDWAVWDDTYEFVAEPNDRYINSNIIQDTFENNSINFMLFINNEQQQVYSAAYDLVDGSEMDFSLSPEFIESEWVNLNDRGEALVIYEEDVGSILTVSEPILTSQEEGPSVGVLMMGKILDSAFFDTMENNLAIDIRVLTEEQDIANAQSEPLAVSDQLLVDAVPISEGLALQVSKERKYYNEKLKSLNDLFLALSLATLMLVFFVYYLLDLFVLSRISFLSGQLKNIDFDQPKSLKIEKLKDGKDEITDLEKSVRSMLESLEKAHTNVTQIAYFDYLTKLPNRFSLYRDFDVRTAKDGLPFAILFFDLDGFKRINDLYGHNSGDELLQQIGQRLSQADYMDEGHRLYRIGGDEFILLVPYSRGPQIISLIEALMADIRKEFVLSTVSTSISSSVGVSFYPEDGKTLEDLLRFADDAMYEAKKSGKNNYYFYYELENRDMYQYMLTLKEGIFAAITLEQLYVEYQPIMHTCGKQIARVEALVRWKHPQYGIISPAQFIPLAEEVGAIRLLGEWVLRKAVKDIGVWNAINEESLAVAVNVSNFQMIDKENLLHTIDQVLAESKFPPELLQIEITESDTAVKDKDIAEFIGELKSRGIRVALDDFGVGSSSLFQLTTLDIDVVKIDRSFLQEVPENTNDTILLSGILQILHNLGIQVVTEGIENEAQLKFVSTQNIAYLQGYYFSKPVPLEQLLEVRDELLGQLPVRGNAGS